MGVVGLLSVGVLSLILVLLDPDDGEKHAGASVVVDYGADYGADDVAGLDTPAPPTASASGAGQVKKAEDRKDAKSSASPSAPTSPRSSASGKDAQAPDSTAAPEDGPRTGTSSSPAGFGVHSHDSQRCLDVVGGKAVPGARLMIWDCSGSASQHWAFPSDGTMRVLGMCVQLAGGSTADGAVLRLAGCDGGPAQQFELNQRHDVVSKLADKCADVQDEGTANGTLIQLWTCNGHDNQKWSES
ncbi:ricin-type beta-trefoil lectin domain protein [Streptomyces sp. NPDC060184]|uniref:ricin-type beta-trefoil lectin domain protein n=1 Tax=Streptomyces sp. NPDC060184 TaxID=3347064 RepID=UPI00365CAED8